MPQSDTDTIQANLEQYDSSPGVILRQILTPYLETVSADTNCCAIIFSGLPRTTWVHLKRWNEERVSLLCRVNVNRPNGYTL